MMEYDVFKNVVLTRIKEFLPSVFAEFDVRVVSVPKINGMKEAMILEFGTDSHRMAGPNIYFDDLYDMFSECGDLDRVLSEAAYLIIECTGTDNYYGDENCDLSDYKEHIVQMLINTDMNEQLLKTAPHKDFLDLSLIYRLVVPDADGLGCATALITDDMLDDLGVTVDELDRLAEENSLKLLPPYTVRIGPEVTMFTTTKTMYGAINLLRTDEIQKLADMAGSNLYLLPSSIHDLMILEDNGLHKEEELFAMVKIGNEKCNRSDENLSFNIYYYDRKKRTLEVKYCDR